MIAELTPWKRYWSETREIFQGGQGIVTELRSLSEPTRRAVLKQIVPHWKDDAQAKQRLKQEGEVLSKLCAAGARVPELIDSFVNHESAEPFLVMEFIPGVRFDEWLKTAAPVNVQQAAAITLAIAKTIELCHKHSIGHRDLKPANIILKNENIADPYIIDFGISFDSRQTLALTREGEMFRNEFIILPEFQDLEGGHRELRSDITALVGVFFTCLTGVPPVVLLDAEELPPHRRHEELVAKSASSVEQGEKLMWLFRRGFAFRPTSRFQSMAEFTTELSQFVDGSPEVGLDAIEQFKIFDQTVKTNDRNLQLILLARKYQGLVEGVDQQLRNRFSSLREREGDYNHFSFPVSTELAPSLPAGDSFSGNNIHGFQIYRQNFRRTAVVLLTGMAQKLDLHLYICGYVGNLTDPTKPTKKIAWEQVAIIDSTHEVASGRTVDVAANAVDRRLARELRNLTNQT